LRSPLNSISLDVAGESLDGSYAMTKRVAPASLLIFLLGAVACSGEPPHTVHTLPSGKQFKVLGMAKMAFPQGPPALMLRYLTEIDIQDRVALRREADEIWPVFRVDVEKANLSDAILSANRLKGSIINTGSSYNFVFKKNAAGAWTCLDDRK
jgi:hypothetical protein